MKLGLANAKHDAARHESAVSVDNRDGGGAFVIVCDHASNFMPLEFRGLGLTHDDLQRHIAWDPGALGVSQVMSKNLNAPLIHSSASRLLIDCNRPLDAYDLIAQKSESTDIAGNIGLSATQRADRIARFYDPFHSAIEDVVLTKTAAGQRPGFIAVHSFNPTYRGLSRPWEIGIIHDDDAQWALEMVLLLKAETGLTVGINEPYSPQDRVYFTLERHARSRNLPAVMIEIRNDEITTPQEQTKWGDLLSRVAQAGFKELNAAGAGHAQARQARAITG